MLQVFEPAHVPDVGAVCYVLDNTRAVDQQALLFEQRRHRPRTEAAPSRRRAADREPTLVQSEALKCAREREDGRIVHSRVGMKSCVLITYELRELYQIGWA